MLWDNEAGPYGSRRLLVEQHLSNFFVDQLTPKGRQPTFEKAATDMAWAPVKLVKDTVLAFIDDEALSRGAPIAFYAVTSVAPVLLIVIAIAGLAFGHDAAENAVKGQLSALMGEQTADVIQTAVANASGKSSGILATLIGIATLIATASGVFGEMQSALNAIWKVQPSGTTLSRLVRARAASLGLIAALGFLLMVSLVVSAGLTAFGNYLPPPGSNQ
jgi:membrane protein